MKFHYKIFCLLIMISTCTERPKDNPFDPNSENVTPVSLSLSYTDHAVTLSWEVEGLQDFNGYRLYRSLDDSAQFELYREFPREIKTFTDTSLQFYQWYFYRITATGLGTETQPSNTVKIYPGPGNIWILSKYGYFMENLTYDLLHSQEYFTVQFPPHDWDWDASGNSVWLAFPQYRQVGNIDLDTGTGKLFWIEQSGYPADLLWDKVNQRLLILDQENKQLYMFKESAVYDSLSFSAHHIFKIAITDQSHIIALGDSLAHIYSPQGILRKAVTFLPGFVGMDVSVSENMIYILAVNQHSEQSQIIQFNPLTNIEKCIQPDPDGFFTLLLKEKKLNYFWACEASNPLNHTCVKLSLTGERLLEISSLSAIYEIMINPYDQSLITVHRYDDTISVFDSLGNLVSRNSQVYDPIKAFVR